MLGGTGRGDVAFRFDEDLFAVDGSATRSVKRVSRLNGDVTTFAHREWRENLLSIAVGFGDERGYSSAIRRAASGRSLATAALRKNSSTRAAMLITGLAIAPAGFGDLGGSLFAAAGDSGIWRIPTGDPAQPEGSTRVAIVMSTSCSRERRSSRSTPRKEDRDGEPERGSCAVAVYARLHNARGDHRRHSARREIYVADAGDGDDAAVHGARRGRSADRTRGLPLRPGCAERPRLRRSRRDRVRHDRPARDPRLHPAANRPQFGLAFVGPTVGYGDLEFDRLGAFVLAANDLDDSLTNNFLLGVSRDGASVTVLASGVGSPLEELLGVAVVPKQEEIYFSTRRGNVYRRASDGAVSLLVNVPPAARSWGSSSHRPGFDRFKGHLIATTADGQVFAIDPASPTPPSAL